MAHRWGVATSAMTILLLVCSIANAVEMRVLSYNIRHCRGADNRVDVERIAAVIQAARPDLVALSEVDRGVSRSGNIDQPATLGRLTGMHVAFEKNIDFDGGEYGNAILSRYPIALCENIALPSHHRGEQRGMLVVQVETAAAEPIWFAATHWDHRTDDGERLDSVAAIERLVATRWPRSPFILAGDLNATPDSRVVQRLGGTWTVLESKPTFPADAPQKQIDFVACRPAGRWRAVSTEVVDEPVASDHRPVLTVLQLVE